MVEVRDYQSPVRPTWCKGCGDYGIWNSLKLALAELDLAPHEVLMVSGIGCGSKTPDYTHVNGLHTLHGRSLPPATGARLANHEMTVICVHGDGDGYGMGLGHMMHAARRNMDIVDVVQNNRVYGLTKGQYSPTSPAGFVSKTSPGGAIDRPVNPWSLALAAGATFIARGFSVDLRHLIEILKKAIQHRGYALVDVLQPCVSFNRAYAYNYYQPRVYKVEEEPGYDPADRAAAWERAHEWGDRIPIGILYQAEGVPTYEDQVAVLRAGPLVKQGFREWTEEDYAVLRSGFM
ncbi:MAG: 2-oxoacid ferredoxin oxidoreductase [Chloroflexi bacterium B3_Chlor]|nr:MAG: 2-oxoacid ferredoxin oxidoreductase [Chloroflexi bacterium B3_Chlor]